MYAAHFAVGLAAKGAEPRAPMWALMLACSCPTCSGWGCRSRVSSGRAGCLVRRLVALGAVHRAAGLRLHGAVLGPRTPHCGGDRTCRGQPPAPRSSNASGTPTALSAFHAGGRQLPARLGGHSLGARQDERLVGRSRGGRRPTCGIAVAVSPQRSPAPPRAGQRASDLRAAGPVRVTGGLASRSASRMSPCLASTPCQS